MGRVGRYRSGIFSLLVTGILFVATSLWALNICPKCGYENAEGVSVCTHCEAKYTPPETVTDKRPGQEVEDQPVTEKPKYRSDYPIAKEEVQGDLERASAAYKAGKPALARLYVLNAMGLLVLVDPESREERWGEPLVQSLATIEKAVSRERVQCAVCEGSGKRKISRAGFDGQERVLTTAGGKCKQCGGSGEAERLRSAESLALQIGQAKRVFDRVQRALGRELAGETWLPAGVSDALKVRRRAAVYSANPTHCSRCAGFGIVACSGCDGAGAIACRAGCNNGWVESKEEGLGSSIGSSRKRCEECGGAGAVTCTRCTGVGGTACSACGGTGTGEICTRCAGTGCSECRRCRGTGVYREEPCATCKGEGVTLCTTCRGSGKRTR